MSRRQSWLSTNPAPDAADISFRQLKRTVRLGAVIRRDSETFLPDEVERSGKASNQIGVSFPGHLPDGGLADEDQEDEESSQHVQAPDNSKRQLEKWIEFGQTKPLVIRLRVNTRKMH